MPSTHTASFNGKEIYRAVVPSPKKTSKGTQKEKFSPKRRKLWKPKKVAARIAELISYAQSHFFAYTDDKGVDRPYWYEKQKNEKLTDEKMQEEAWEALNPISYICACILTQRGGVKDGVPTEDPFHFFEMWKPMLEKDRAKLVLDYLKDEDK